MTGQRSDWRQLYELAQLENNPRRQKELCEEARRAIQNRSIDLAEAKKRDPAEENALNEALRELWKLQNLP